MTNVVSRQTPEEVVRFLIVGGLNTLLTGALFLVLSSIWPVAFAYSVAFAVGIAFAVIVTPMLVFRARAARSQRVRYAGWYVAVYTVGLGLVSLLHDWMLLGNVVVAVITFATTAAMSFVGARFLFSPRTVDDSTSTDSGLDR